MSWQICSTTWYRENIHCHHLTSSQQYGLCELLMLQFPTRLLHENCTVWTKKIFVEDFYSDISYSNPALGLFVVAPSMLFLTFVTCLLLTATWYVLLPCHNAVCNSIMAIRFVDHLEHWHISKTHELLVVSVKLADLQFLKWERFNTTPMI